MSIRKTLIFWGFKNLIFERAKTGDVKLYQKRQPQSTQGHGLGVNG